MYICRYVTDSVHACGCVGQSVCVTDNHRGVCVCVWISECVYLDVVQPVSGLQ